MRIVNLIEDTKGNKGCAYEHGLSFYIETKKHKILLDTGASNKFIENAKMLGIDLTKVDIVIISHGHYDHTGGLLAFTQINSDAKIFIQDSAKGEFYNCRENLEKYIGMDKKIVLLEQVEFLKGDYNIDDEIDIYTGIIGRKLWPESNKILKEKCDGKFVQDSFIHEQYLVICEEGKKILLSGCAHNGILNILERFQEKYGTSPDAVISGFHMMKKEEYLLEEINTIKETAYILKTMNTRFFTGHCTGEKAISILKDILQERLVEIHSGDSIML